MNNDANTKPSWAYLYETYPGVKFRLGEPTWDSFRADIPEEPCTAVAIYDAFAEVVTPKPFNRRSGRMSPWKVLRYRQRLVEIGALLQHRHARMDGWGFCDTDDAELWLEAALPHLDALGIPAREWATLATPNLLKDPAFAWINETTPQEEWDRYHAHIVRAAVRGSDKYPITLSEPTSDPRTRRRVSFAYVGQEGENGMRTARLLDADEMADLLRVTPEERKLLDLRTIGAIGTTKTTRAKDRSTRKATKKKMKRAADGATPREQSLTATKPWEDYGYSERHWRRLVKAGKLPDPRQKCPDVRNSDPIISSPKGSPKKRTLRPGHTSIPARSASRGRRRAPAPQAKAA